MVPFHLTVLWYLNFSCRMVWWKVPDDYIVYTMVVMILIATLNVLWKPFFWNTLSLWSSFLKLLLLVAFSRDKNHTLNGSLKQIRNWKVTILNQVLDSFAASRKILRHRPSKETKYFKHYGHFEVQLQAIHTEQMMEILW